MVHLRSLVLTNSTYYASQGINCLEGLAAAPALERLSLLDPPALDLGQFCPPSLRHLSVSNYDMRDLDLNYVIRATGLESIEFEGCRIADLEPLMGLANLRVVTFRQCSGGIAEGARLLTGSGVQVQQE
jgi:hypothetical protein